MDADPFLQLCAQGVRVPRILCTLLGLCAYYFNSLPYPGIIFPRMQAINASGSSPLNISIADITINCGELRTVALLTVKCRQFS